jgi:hypothetical protein
MKKSDAELLGVAIQMSSRANSQNNPSMKVLLDHYSKLVEQLTGVPASETLALLTEGMEKESASIREKAKAILLAALDSDDSIS